MISQNDILADLHTHSIFSLHAYSTVQENIYMAKKNKMKYIAITDHFYQDGTVLNKKNEVNRIKHMERNINRDKNIHVVAGAEFNIGQDVQCWYDLKNIKWRPIGLHNSFCDIKNLTLEELYQLFEKSSEHHNVFAHIERGINKIICDKNNELSDDEKDFFGKMIILSKEKNIFLEVNENSLSDDKKGNISRCKYWLRLAKENGNNISLGTDAHYSENVGVFKNSIDLLNEVDYPKKLILNCDSSQMKSIFIR